MTNETKTIEIEKIQEDQRFPDSTAYIFYGDAKKAGIQQGDTFNLSDGGSEVFEVIEYVKYRNDINRNFSGFRCELKN